MSNAKDLHCLLMLKGYVNVNVYVVHRTHLNTHTHTHTYAHIYR